MIAFLFSLAIFDLWVGVSNDAVNFMNSAIGSKVARFRTIVFVAAIGIFFGATMSDGMMEIARHGIMRPEFFSFRDVMTIFLAVITSDIILMNIFNTLGMPTSTTVSMVFNLLGATSATAVLKILHGAALPLSSYLNTDKVLEVIMAIFLSVAIAFFLGMIIQFISRVVFTFNYKKGTKWRTNLFGGIAITIIIFFLVFKGLKSAPFMTPQVLNFIETQTPLLLGACLAFFTLFMMVLNKFRINVFKVVILLGTFALASAFASNDLVNFIGVPLAGYSSFMDFSASGSTDATTFMMTSLNGPAHTPVYFLIIAGSVMVFALAKSKKAQNVTKTQVGLSSRQEGDELFGSSRIARSLVRFAGTTNDAICRCLPSSLLQYINKRFAPFDEEDSNKAAYDQLRASVNIVVAALLIALGTSLKLPLSTTYVTFMVAMGASLADRAWGRESAVFRVTGVLTVIGGWFITAGIAFVLCFTICFLMNIGGFVAFIILIALALGSLANSKKILHRDKSDKAHSDLLFYEIIHCQNRNEVLPMLRRHVAISITEILKAYTNDLLLLTDDLFYEKLHRLRITKNRLHKGKAQLKDLRKRETIALKCALPIEIIRLSTSFHLIHNSLYQLRYGLLRIAEPALEHVDNHFTPIRKEYYERFIPIRDRIVEVANVISDDVCQQIPARRATIYNECEEIISAILFFRTQLLKDELELAGGDYKSTALLLHIVEECGQYTLQLRTIFDNCREFEE